MLKRIKWLTGDMVRRALLISLSVVTGQTPGVDKIPPEVMGAVGIEVSRLISPLTLEVSETLIPEAWVLVFVLREGSRWFKDGRPLEWAAEEK